VAFVALLDRVGMILGTALFLVVVLRFVEGYSWHRSAGVALGAAAACYLVFVHWLRVPFPAGALGF
jgi:predicted branched-subunit amino acid permease